MWSKIHNPATQMSWRYCIDSARKTIEARIQTTTTIDKALGRSVNPWGGGGHNLPTPGLNRVNWSAKICGNHRPLAPTALYWRIHKARTALAEKKNHLWDKTRKWRASSKLSIFYFPVCVRYICSEKDIAKVSYVIIKDSRKLIGF